MIKNSYFSTSLISISYTLCNYLLRFITLQLYLTLISIPILIYHGLAFSLLTFVGNLVFTPVLISYLIIASVFMLLALGNMQLILISIMLNLITKTWLAITSYSLQNCLIAFKRPPY